MHDTQLQLSFVIRLKRRCSAKKASRNYVKVLELFKQKESNAVLLLNTVNER